MKELIEKLLGAPTMEFCEKAGEGLIRRPVYAVSDLIYHIVGLFIVFKGKGNRLSKIFGYMAIVIGTFSLIYDITYTYISQLFDLAGMLIFANILLFLNLKRFIDLEKIKWHLFLSLVTLSLIIIFILGGASGIIIFGIFVSMVIATEILLLKRGEHKNPKDWVVGMLLFLVGFAFWIPDGAGQIWCDPNNIINGRSIFHFATAFTIYFLYKFYLDQESGKKHDTI